MNDIIQKEFDIDENIVAKSIYGEEERKLSSEGIEISNNIKREFEEFLESYIEFIGMSKTTFFRVDAYFDENTLYILDINGSFVDGWGNTLNLSRSINQQIDNIMLSKFPENMYLQEEIYRPEFELFINELNIAGIKASEIDKISPEDKTYIYGTESRKDNLFPYDGLRVDNKMNLALFSRIWNIEAVNIKIPEFILPSQTPWQDVGKDYAFKVIGKQDIPGLPWKIKIGKPKNGKLGARLWEEGKLIAQELVKPYTDSDGNNNQAIIMTIDNNPITGYVQKSVDDIINDNSVQGPLVFK